MVGETGLAPYGISVATIMILAGIIVLGLFATWSVRQSRRGRTPLFHVQIFQSTTFTSGVALGFLFQLAVGGLLFVLPVFLQSGIGLDAMKTGLTLLPYTLGIFIFALGASRLPGSLPAHRLVQGGLLVMLLGAFWVQATASLVLEPMVLEPALFVFGAGAGVVLARLPELTLSTITPSEVGEASGGDSTGRELGVAFGVAVLGSIFLAIMFTSVVDKYDAYHNITGITAEQKEQADIELEDWAAKTSDQEWHKFLSGLPEATSKAYSTIVAESFLSGYRITLKIITGVIAVMICVSFLFRKSGSNNFAEG